MEKRLVKHFMYCPWTGLGLFNGFRGNVWLKNRIKVFKAFVVPSLQAQTNKDFTLLCSWRAEEKNNPYVRELMKYLEGITEFKTVHSFHGILFYDDKYEDSVARERLVNSLHYTVGDLYDELGEADTVLMTIQPSDDLYHRKAVEVIQNAFEKYPDLQGIGFSKGYIMSYTTGDVAEYNPKTNPPFYTIKFTREQFTNPLRHIEHTALKKDVGKYKAGTPLPSHEYVGDCLKYRQVEDRGFLVGTHGANISTHYNIPYKGETVGREVLKDFGVYDVKPIKIKVSLFRRILFKLPQKWQRKVRYWVNEKLKLRI